MRIKQLKLVNKQSIRDAIIYMMGVHRLGKWWVPRHMQACMWAIGAKVSEDEIKEIMDDIYLESLDHPQNHFERIISTSCIRYKCAAYFSPTRSS